MKKIFLAILISAGSTFVFAQTKTSETFNAMESSRQMYGDLQLNEAQYVKVRQTNQLKADRMRDLEQVYRNDPQMMEQKRAALNTELDAEFQSILRPDQYDMYLTSEGRNTNMNSDMGSGSEMIQSDTDVKMKNNNTKVKSEGGESKVKTDNVKIKNENDKYKYQDSRDNSKVKATDNKLKIEDKNSKIKVEEDKVKIKSRD